MPFPHPTQDLVFKLEERVQFVSETSLFHPSIEVCCSGCGAKLRTGVGTTTFSLCGCLHDIGQGHLCLLLV